MDKNIVFIKNMLEHNFLEREFKVSCMKKYLNIYNDGLFLKDVFFLKKLNLFNMKSINKYKNIITKCGFNLPNNVQKIVFVNGYYSFTENIDKRIVVKSFMKNYKDILPCLLKFYKDDDFRYLNFFSLINYIFYIDGLYMFIPDNQAIERPLYVLNYFTDSSEFSMVNSRFFLSLGKKAKISVLNYYVIESSKLFVNVNVSMSLGYGSYCDYCYVNDAVLSTLTTYSCLVKQEENSILRSRNFSFGKQICKLSLKCLLLGRYAKVDVGFSRYLKEFSVEDVELDIYHISSNTCSNSLFKSLVNDGAKCTFNGNINVNLNINKIVAKLMCNGLVLSNDAQIVFVPKLCIESDNVECFHGATIGHVDEEVILYMMSRGISKKECMDLLVNMFLSTVLDRDSKFFDIQRDLLIKKYFV